MLVSPVNSNAPACATENLDPLDFAIAAAAAGTLTALSDPVRLQILDLIRRSESGAICACTFIEPVKRSQPTVSHHLKVLAEAGLVSTERRGRWIWYSLTESGRAALAAVDLVLSSSTKPAHAGGLA
ncbi:MAG: metalloregulator ArsR/SmtB family transcription factor [Actinomycetota bacterium]|nr:metalloregulator ArsR/SmtB family transcription factor [Actinomycetota bacterium]